MKLLAFAVAFLVYVGVNSPVPTPNTMQPYLMATARNRRLLFRAGKYKGFL